MKVDYKLEVNKKTDKRLRNIGDSTMKIVARTVLDMAYSRIPLSDRVNNGRLRRSAYSYGVQQNRKGMYSIGNEVGYASYVWNMGNNTNWTTPGTSEKWYEKTLKEKGDIIIADAIRKANNE